MPKIRDLAISTIPAGRAPMLAFWGEQQCTEGKSAPAPEEGDVMPADQNPACDGSQPENPNEEQQKNVSGLPGHAVLQLRQQLQHHISL